MPNSVQDENKRTQNFQQKTTMDMLNCAMVCCGCLLPMLLACYSNHQRNTQQTRQKQSRLQDRTDQLVNGPRAHIGVECSKTAALASASKRASASIPPINHRVHPETRPKQASSSSNSSTNTPLYVNNYFTNRQDGSSPASPPRRPFGDQSNSPSTEKHPSPQMAF